MKKRLVDSAGILGLYIAAGNVSASRSASVTVTGSSGVADISTQSSLDLGSVKVNESVEKNLKVTNK